MVTKIQKWGNSQGVRVSKEILEQAHVFVGDTVDVHVENNQIVIKPQAYGRKKHDLKQLVAEIPPEYKTQEVDWGKTQGREVW